MVDDYAREIQRSLGYSLLEVLSRSALQERPLAQEMQMEVRHQSV